LTTRLARKSIRIRVKAGDTDFTGFIFHPRIIEWFSAGRIELLRSKKIALLKDGSLSVDGQQQKVSIVVGEVYARFHGPIKFDDLVCLQTRISEIRDKTIKFDFVIKHVGDDRPLVTGYSTSVCVDRETRRATSIPARMVELLTT